jgi:steroid delta-isomerase-like uncharacterized protein
METRRDALVATGLGVALMLLELRSAQAQVPSGCLPSDSEAAAFAISDRYVAAVNAGNAATLPAIFAEDYIQHSGRSPSGLAGQIANFHAIRTVFPNLHLVVEDRIFGDGKLVTRNVFTGTQRARFRGFEPTGKLVTIRTIDIWRIADGKLAEHRDVVDFAEVDRQLRGA